MTESITQPLLEAMKFRCIGPPRGGRVVAVAGCPSNPAVFYFGAVAGGIWKTAEWQVLAAISAHQIDPQQAFAILQSFATAAKLLKQD